MARAQAPTPPQGDLGAVASVLRPAVLAHGRARRLQREHQRPRLLREPVAVLVLEAGGAGRGERGRALVDGLDQARHGGEVGRREGDGDVDGLGGHFG